MDLISSIEKAVELGLITGAVFPVPAMDWQPPGLSPEIRTTANAIESGPVISVTPANQQWDDPALDTRAQLYQDNGFYRSYVNGGGAVDGNAYEIARFQANAGECGFVKYIGTYVQILDAGVPVELDFSNPQAMQDAGLNAIFTLRLSPGDENTIGTAPWVGPVENTPGYGYPQLPYWNDYRFYWGRYANHVWFLVPRRHFLRLFIHTVSGSANLHRSLGRLQGYTQPISTLGADYNVVHGW